MFVSAGSRWTNVKWVEVRRESGSRDAAQGMSYADQHTLVAGHVRVTGSANGGGVAGDVERKSHAERGGDVRLRRQRRWRRRIAGAASARRLLKQTPRKEIWEEDRERCERMG